MNLRITRKVSGSDVSRTIILDEKAPVRISRDIRKPVSGQCSNNERKNPSIGSDGHTFVQGYRNQHYLHHDSYRSDHSASNAPFEIQAPAQFDVKHENYTLSDLSNKNEQPIIAAPYDPKEIRCPIEFSENASSSVVEPTPSSKSCHEENRLHQCSLTHIEAVEQAIMCVCEAEKPYDQPFVCATLNDIKKVVERNFQAWQLRLYGSYFSQLAIASSDINLELVTPVSNILADIKFLHALSKLLSDELPGYHIQFNDSPNVRQCYIACTEPKLGAKCLIRFLGHDKSYYGFSELFMKLNFLDKSRVQPLVVAFRYWAEVCSIHEEENGRLHPVALVLMVVHFLQRTRPPILPIISVKDPIQEIQRPLTPNHETIGELWLGLLKYYASEFNWRDQVISVTSSEVKLKSDYKWGKCWIGIESPFDENVNVAKSVVCQDVSIYIQACFEKTLAYFADPSDESLTTDEELRYNINDGESVSAKNNSLSPSNQQFFFSTHAFTEGLNAPTMCQECMDLGYTCEDCATDAFDDEDENCMPELPKSFIETITHALEEASVAHLLNNEEIALREKLVYEMEVYIRKRIPAANLQLIGSSVNGFGLKNSDMDICMTIDNKGIEEVDQKRNIRKLCYHLRRSTDFGSVVAVYTAKIPLVKFHHVKANICGDISIYNMLAVYNTQLLHSYCIIDPRTKILGCAVKLMAKNACIAESAEKTLSSYSYILMVIHFLQTVDPPVLPVLQELYEGDDPPQHVVEDCNVWFFRYRKLDQLNQVWKREPNTMSVGQLWVDFLKYYTEKYSASTVISIRQKKPMSAFNTKCHARLFNIEDPFITSKNLGSIMSEETSRKTWKTLLRAKKLFGRPIEHIPSGFQSFSEYFFDPMCLTDGSVAKSEKCKVCGKLGHSSDKCAYSNRNFMPKHRPPLSRTNVVRKK